VALPTFLVVLDLDRAILMRIGSIS
jgi:hypothetical protein